MCGGSAVAFPIKRERDSASEWNAGGKETARRWVGLIRNVPRHKGVRRFFRAFPPAPGAASGWFSRVFRARERPERADRGGARAAAN